MLFVYQALDQKGKKVQDSIDAQSEKHARQLLRQKGLYPVELRRQDDADKDEERQGGKIVLLLDRFLEKRRGSRHVALFSRQLSTLLKAGLPLVTALSDIQEQQDDRSFRSVVASIKNAIEEGSSFSTALYQHKHIFSAMYISMVQVGENLGSLEEVMERLAENEEKKNLLKNRIQAALWYPAFMFLFALGILAFLMINVIPTITDMFVQQGQVLPLPTRIIMAISGVLSSYWYIFPILLILFWYMFHRYTGTEEGRYRVDELKMRLPLVSNLYNRLIVLRFTQNLGVLLHNRVDILKSFEIVKNIVGNVVIEKKIAEASVKIREGSTVTTALKSADFLPKLVIGMITAGEASDQLDKMLLNIAGVYETEIDLSIGSLTSLIEPVVIIIMGLIIGTIVMSVMLPMMEMNMMIQ